jgi:hypothetical protein
MMPTFSEHYGARHRLPAADFDRAVLRRILYPHARLLAPLIRLTQPDYFDADLDLVRTVARILRLRQFD